jgi:hypothetical protein
MQRVHALLSAHLSDGAMASHSTVPLSNPGYVSSSSSSCSSCSGTSSCQEAAAYAADSLQTAQQESQQLPSTCRSQKDETVGAAAVAATAAESSKGMQADTVTATTAVTSASADAPPGATVPGDAAAKATEPDAVTVVPGAPLVALRESASAEHSAEAVWKKSAANGRWQLKLQHSSRQRSGATQLTPHSAAAAGKQQLPNLQDALDAAASTAIGSMVRARGAGRGPVSVTSSSSSSKGSSSTLQAGLGAANTAGLEAARCKLLELLCSAVHTEVRPLPA